MLGLLVCGVRAFVVGWSKWKPLSPPSSIAEILIKTVFYRGIENQDINVTIKEPKDAGLLK